jgi:hypothetical protein
MVGRSECRCDCAGVPFNSNRFQRDRRCGQALNPLKIQMLFGHQPDGIDGGCWPSCVPGVGTNPMWRSGKRCSFSFGTAPNTGMPVYSSMLRVRMLCAACRPPGSSTTPPMRTPGRRR